MNCATIGIERESTSNRVVGHRLENETSKTLTPEVTQDGTKVHVEVWQRCKRRTYNRVETVEHYNKVNQTPGKDWAFGIGGATFAGLGVWALADSSKVYPNDKSSRTYNPVGPGAELGMGIASLAVGGALLAVAVADIVRANGTEDKPSFTERKGELAGSCRGTPVGNKEVTARFDLGDKAPMTLGRTNAEGALDTDLATLSPPPPAGDLEGEPYGSDLIVLVDGKRAGQASLSVAYKAWRPGWAETRAAEAERKASAEREKEQRSHAQDLAALEEIEKAMAAFAKNNKKAKGKLQWTGEALASFGRLRKLAEGIRNRSSLTEPEKARFQKAVAVLDSLIPSYEKALAEHIAQQDQNAVARGWDALKTELRAPSTAVLSRYAIKLRCSRGHIIWYEFDSQNGFGAMVRGKGVVKINFANGFNARVEGQTVAGMSPYEILLRAAARGDCSELE